MELVERVLAGNRRAVARAITLVENDVPGADEILARLHMESGRAHIVGVTGPPGGGKSTLVSQMVREYRRRDKTVGVIAVDPSSPFTGGALLGDRIRMQDIMTDPGVFIRSMATRGHLGGVSEATADAIKILDASGRDVVIVETVGTGQSEVDIARTAHTTVVVEVPGLGDDVQAIKAGLMEIADIFVVNKADQENADKVVMALQMALRLGPPAPWTPPIVKCIARDGEGIDTLVDKIGDHWAFLQQDYHLIQRERERARFQLLEMAERRLRQRLLTKVGEQEFARIVDDVANRRTDPYTAINELLASVGVKN